MGVKVWDTHVRMRSIVLGYWNTEYSRMGTEVTKWERLRGKIDQRGGKRIVKYINPNS